MASCMKRLRTECDESDNDDNDECQYVTIRKRLESIVAALDMLCSYDATALERYGMYELFGYYAKILLTPKFDCHLVIILRKIDALSDILLDDWRLKKCIKDGMVNHCKCVSISNRNECLLAWDHPMYGRVRRMKTQVYECLLQMKREHRSVYFRTWLSKLMCKV